MPERTINFSLTEDQCNALSAVLEQIGAALQPEPDPTDLSAGETVKRALEQYQQRQQEDEERPKKRKVVPRWTTIQAAPWGVFYPGQRFEVRDNRAGIRADVVLNDRLEFQLVDEPEVVSDSPSTIAGHVLGGTRNGFDYIFSRESGMKLSELRQRWVRVSTGGGL